MTRSTKYLTDATMLLDLPRSPVFWIERNQGQYTFGHKESLYIAGSDPDGASFDFGNNRVLCNVSIDGSIKTATFFKSSYYADNIPGVWVHKDASTTGPLCFGLNWKGREIRLNDHTGRLFTGLIQSVLPFSEYEFDEIIARTYVWAPISEDGEDRAGCLFYALLLTNTSDQTQKGQALPPLLPHFSQVHADNTLPDMIWAHNGRRAEAIEFNLRPGQSVWLPLVIRPYGSVATNLNTQVLMDPLYSIEQTLAYYQHLSGDLAMPDDPFMQDFFVRCIHQCQQCIGMDESGFLSGSSWGTNPTTKQIWMKDMFYSMLPLAQVDSALFRKGIEWFARYGVRPAGSLFAGGVTHSLSNSLSAIVMAAIYFDITADLNFFRQKPDLINQFNQILDEMILSRQDPDIWLFPSIWISDGLSMGSYHTGSNIVAWKALQGWSNILMSLGQSNMHRDLTDYSGAEQSNQNDIRARSQNYLLIAERVKEALMQYGQTESGPFGRQWLEGIGKGSAEMQQQMQAESYEAFKSKNRGFGVQFYAFFNQDFAKPYLIHDGEETDTTLIPYYGLSSYDDQTFQNYVHFGVSKYNRFYRETSQGILWEECTDSTFPGYVTGAASITDRAQYVDPQGPFAGIRKLTDYDGSIWWWPYPFNAVDHSLIQRVPGKCGWAAGAFIALMIHDWLGLQWQASEQLLSFCPLNILGPFLWTDAPFGMMKFDLAYQTSQIVLNNKNPQRIRFLITIEAENIEISGVSGLKCQIGRTVRFGKNVTEVNGYLLPGEQVTVSVSESENLA